MKDNFLCLDEFYQSFSLRMISIDNITVEFGGNALFENVSFLIKEKEKIALIGRNGAGKTTLLKLIAGEMSPTRGNISRPKNLTIGYLPQHIKVNDSKTVREETLTAFENIFAIRANIATLTAELNERDDFHTAEYGKLIEELGYQNERLQMFDSDSIEAETEKTLMGLGFRRTDFERRTSEFSGGWRMRIELAKILLRKPDLLLLDEPTNHLDIESINWLESFLKNSKSALLLVSHDKAFVDAVTTRTIEISLGKIYDYKANYSRYLELRAIDRENQIRAYENQQKLIADTQDFINRFRYKPTKAVQVQSRIKMLEKLEPIQIEEVDNSRLNLRFPLPPHSGTISLDIENLTKAYGEHTVLQNIDMQIRRGEKIAFVGKNGEGKTTLVKCIVGELDFMGSLRLGHNVKVGYFAQNQAATLDDSKTVFQTVDDIATGDIRTKLRNILGAFMFGGDDIDKRVAVLSGGERSRLAMIKLLLSPVNMLILDEPTNHLDISTKNVLKDAIRQFPSSAIIVSHDRDFLDGLVDKVYEFADKKIIEHIGGIGDFLRAKNFNSLHQIEIKNTDKKDIAPQAVSDSKLQYEQNKERARQIKKQERQIELLESDIADLEKEIARLEAEFTDGNSSDELSVKYHKTQHLLEQKMYEWEILSEELEKIKQ
ncbi:ABC transporter, ATP-binding protein [Bacteroidetes oral taxon 274 str. F0058]|nr:ABC transporter, ATP-binding protein [Bacteroidetes oral taxon 274 str. F0058]